MYEELVEDVQQVTVGQDHDLVTDRAVELAPVVDVPGGFPRCAAVGGAGEKDRLPEGPGMDQRFYARQRAARGSGESVEDGVGALRCCGMSCDCLIVVV